MDDVNIIYTEEIKLPVEDESLKPEVSHNQKGNLVQLAEDVAHTIVDSVDAVATKIHDLFVGPS